MSMRAFILLLFSFVVIFSTPLYAKDDEASLKEKAAAQLIDSMPDFFKDVIALEKMSPQDKINYILNQSEARIKEKIAEKFQEDMKEKLTKYAQEAIRAKAFLTDALPKIRNAYVMGESFDWGSIDSEISSSVDTKMRAFGAALGAAKIGWGAYDAYTSGGSLEAFKSISGEVYDLLADAYIPGWGYFKLGKELVEILGHYVLDYATDTAVEGMLEDMYGMKSNPQGLAEWLINKSPNDIEKDLKRKWDDGMGFGRLWEGQGTDKGDQDMKDRIHGTLVSLRGELLMRQKQEEQKQAALTEKINQYLAKAKQAQDEAGAVAQKAREAAKVELDKVRDFRYKLTGISKQVAQENRVEAQQVFEQDMNTKTWWQDDYPAYQPIDRGSIVSLLEAALSQIHESGNGGYDQQAASVAIEDYKNLRKSILDAAAKQPAVYRDRIAKDVQVLAAEENVVVLEAKERMMKRYQAILAAIIDTRKQFTQAGERYLAKQSAFSEEVSNKLNHPGNWRLTLEKVPDYSQRTKVFSQPGDAAAELSSLRALRNELSEDESVISGLHSKEKSAFAEYISELQSIKLGFKQLIPDNLFSTEPPRESTWNVSERLVIKSFYLEQVKLDPGVIDVGHMAISIPAVGGNSFEEYQKFLDVSPSKAFSKLKQELDKRISFLANIEAPDEMAKAFLLLFSRVSSVSVLSKSAQRNLDMEKKYLPEAFNTRNGMSGNFIHAELTTGFNYLKDLRAAWDEQRIVIERLGRLKKAMGKQVKYSWDLQDRIYPIIDNLLLMPQKIKLAEAEYQKSLDITTKRLALVDKYLGEWKERVLALKKGNMPIADRPAEIEQIMKFVNNQISLLKSWGPHPDVLSRLKNVTEFKDELIQRLAEVEEDALKDKQERLRNSEAANALYRAEQAKKTEAENQRKAEQSRPAMPMYNLIDPRLNTVSLRTVSGEVVVSRSDLNGQELELTARLDTIEGVSKILFSEDNRTWKELPLNQNILVSFEPIAGKRYDPVLRIKTADYQDIDMRFFPGIQGLIYQDVEFDQLIVQTVTSIAEAYEQMDIFGFSEYISPDFLGNKLTLEEGIRFDFDLFLSIQLVIYIDRIERRNNQFIVQTHWDKSQTPRNTGQVQKSSGKTTMIFALEQGKFRIQNLRGNLLYATLSPDIAQTSGLSSTVVDAIRVARDARDPLQPGAATVSDSGGVTSSESESNIQTGTFSIIQELGHPGVSGWVQEFSFSNYQVYDAPATLDVTYDFRRREGWMEVKTSNGLQDLGAVGIDGVTSVPSGGYAAQVPWMAGHTFAIELSDGTYALVQPTTDPNYSVFPFTTNFKYRHQRNATRDF
ncbi:MAG: hypothetical protein V1747_09765 [Candidatus Omnitrophota bacterium]